MPQKRQHTLTEQDKRRDAFLHELVPPIGRHLAESAKARHQRLRENADNVFQVRGGFFGRANGVGAMAYHPVEQAFKKDAETFSAPMHEWWREMAGGAQHGMDEEQQAIMQHVKNETAPRFGEYMCYMMLYHSVSQHWMETRQRFFMNDTGTLSVYEHCIRHNIMLQQLRKNVIRVSVENDQGKLRHLTEKYKRKFEALVERTDTGISHALCMWRLEGVPAVTIQRWYNDFTEYAEYQRYNLRTKLDVWPSGVPRTPPPRSAARFPRVNFASVRDRLPPVPETLFDVGCVLRRMTDDAGVLRWGLGPGSGLAGHARRRACSGRVAPFPQRAVGADAGDGAPVGDDHPEARGGGGGGPVFVAVPSHGLHRLSAVTGQPGRRQWDLGRRL